jgi:glutaminase
MCPQPHYNRHDASWLHSNSFRLVFVVHCALQESRWASNIVISPVTADRRGAAIRKLLKVTQACIKLHNYSSAMAIFSGLSAASVQRLKDSWEVWCSISINQSINQLFTSGSFVRLIDRLYVQQLSVKSWKKFSRVEALMSMDGNYRQLREEVRQASLPAIPFMGE